MKYHVLKSIKFFIDADAEKIDRDFMCNSMSYDDYFTKKLPA